MHFQFHRTVLTLALFSTMLLVAACGGEQIGHGGYREGSALLEKNLPVEPSAEEETPVAATREIADAGPAPLNLAADLQGQDVVLTWDEVNPGDYNSDGSVNGLDVFPLAANFNDDVAGNPGHECIDGNGDGTLNGLDLFIVAANFDTRVDGYNVWSSASDAGPFDTQENGSLVDYIGCSSENTLTDLMPALPRWYVARSYDGGGDEESADSNVVSVSASPDTDPPVWSDGVGIQNLLRVGNVAWVYWNEATDADSPPVTYLIGIDTEGPVPWDQDTQVIEVSDPDPASNFDYLYSHELPDWDTVDYYFSIRAQDSASPPNVDDNNVTMDETDTTPPYWPTTVGAQYAERIGDTAFVYWNEAIDDDSPPVRYVLGYGLTNPLDWSNLEHAVYCAPTPSDGGPSYDYKQGISIPEWGETVYYFGIRAEDTPIPGNRDENTVTVEPVSGDTTPPEWDDTTGIQSLMTTGRGALLLFWNNASDAQSDPVTYNVYWDTQTPIRFGAEAIKNENVEVAPAGDFDHSYEVVGLLPGTQYWFAVRAQDSADTPNEDQNTDELELTMPEMITEIIDAGVYDKLYLTSVDDGDNEWIFYQNLNNSTLLYAHNDGIDWSIGTVDSTSGAGNSVSAEIDSDGNPVLAWHNAWEGTLHYAAWNGSGFDIETIDDGGGTNTVGRFCDLELDADGDAAISYVDETDFRLKFAWFDGTDWQVENVDSLGDIFWVNDGSSSVVFDDDDLPMIAYRNVETGAIWIAKRTSSVKGGAPGDWNRQEVSNNGEDNRFPKFMRTVHNTLVLAFFVDFVYQVQLYAYIDSTWQLMINHQLTTYIWNLQLASYATLINGQLIQLMMLAVLQNEGPLLLLPFREALLGVNPVILTYAALLMGSNVYDAHFRITRLQTQLFFVAVLVQSQVLQRMYLPIVVRERN